MSGTILSKEFANTQFCIINKTIMANLKMWKCTAKPKIRVQSTGGREREDTDIKRR